MDLRGLTLILSTLLASVASQTSSTIVNNYICTDDFCDDWKQNNDCTILGEACRAQNSTLNGRIFPSQTPCSCCQVCLENLKQGDDCTIGSPGAPMPNTICGPGLTCTLAEGDEHTKCHPMTSTICFKEQIQYDLDRENGIVGSLVQRPKCGDEGDFSPVKCVPGQTCFCVDKLGNRIFGESIHHSNVDILMKCECSRLVTILPTLVDTDYSAHSARCDEFGSFDNIQCFDDQCVCVHPVTGSPTSAVYNATYGLERLPCFTNVTYVNSTYLRECELRKLEMIFEIAEYQADDIIVLNFDLDFCQPDGYYNRVQQNSTHKYCADVNGTIIEDYIVERGELGSKTINCNCARTVQLMEANNLLELPQCCPNGNYEKVQCRRNLCYCVDENGSQESSEEVPASDIDKLQCAGKVDSFCE